MARRDSKNNLVLFLITTIIVVAALSLVTAFKEPLRSWVTVRIIGSTQADPVDVVKLVQLFLSALLAYLAVRALRVLLWGFFFRLRRGYEAPALVQNVFSIVIFTVVF